MDELSKVCMQAGLTSDEWKDGEFITFKGGKKIRNYFIAHGQIVRAWNFHKLLKRIKK